MKYLICFLLAFVSLDGFSQITASYQFDSSYQRSIDSNGNILFTPRKPLRYNLVADTINLTANKYMPSPVSIYNAGGHIGYTSLKCWVDSIVSPSTSNGLSINISSAGFSQILGVSLSARRNTTNANEVPIASLKGRTTSALSVNIFEPNSSLVNLLGSLVLLGAPLQFATDLPSITIYVTVWGY